MEEIGGYKYGDIIKGWRWSKEIIQINISIKKDNIKISDDKKMQLINNLLVVMTSDSETNPVLNVGS